MFKLQWRRPACVSPWDGKYLSFKAQSEEYFEPLGLSGAWKQLLLSDSPHQPGGSWKPTDFRARLTENELAYSLAQTFLKIRRRDELV